MSAALVALTLVVAAWRLSVLSAEDLWFDEVFSAVLASQEIDGLLRRALADQTNPPGFYLALWAWAHAGSFDTAWLRSLPALAAVAAIPMVAWAARTVGLGRGPALLAATLAAASPLALAMGGEVRTYAALLLVGTVLLGIGARVAAHASAPTRSSLVLLGVLDALIVALHYFGALVVLASLVGTAWVDRRRLGAAFAAAVPSAALLAGWCVAVIVSAGGAAVGTNAGWIGSPRGGAVTSFASQVVGTFGTTWGGWAVLVALLAAAERARRLARSDPASPTARRARWLLAAAFVPLIIVPLVGLATGRPIWVARYLIIVLPPLWLLLADAVAAMPTRSRTAAVAAVLAWASLAGPLAELARPRRTAWSLVVRALAGSAPARICTNESFVALPLEYYAIAEGVPLTVRPLAECVARRDASAMIARPGTEASLDSLARAGAILGPPRAMGTRLPEVSVWPIREWAPR